MESDTRRVIVGFALLLLSVVIGSISMDSLGTRLADPLATFVAGAIASAVFIVGLVILYMPLMRKTLSLLLKHSESQ